MGWYQRRVHGGTTQQTMAFVRCGGRVVAYGRGERERTTWEQKMRFEERTAPPQRVVISQIGDPDAPYLKDIEQLDHENSALQREIDGLNKSISSFTYTQNRHGLDAKYDFGLKGQEAVYQCMIQNTGVGYRNTSRFQDKRNDGLGPHYPECIKADRICQGQAAVFVRSVDGRGWLPLTDPKGSDQIFQYIGKADALNNKHPKTGKTIMWASHENKLSPKKQDEWFSPKQDKRTTLQAVCKTCCNKHLSAYQ